jgi:hypothetical protein
VLHRRTVGTTPVPALPEQLTSGNERTTDHTAAVNRSVAGSERQTTAFASRRVNIAAVTASISLPTAPYLSPLAPAPRSADRLADGFPTSSRGIPY